jgi:hypothetical protein
VGSKEDSSVLFSKNNAHSLLENKVMATGENANELYNKDGEADHLSRVRLNFLGKA